MSLAVDRSPSGSDVWVVQIAGGFYCDDDVLQCADRPTRFITALAHDREVIPDGGRWPGIRAGLFSRDPEDNPTFHDANHVVVHYCSSDLWLGDRTDRQPNTGSEQGWYFSGRHVLAAGLGSLPEVGFDPADPDTRVLLVGQSSGGIGLASNLDTVVGAFPALVGTDRLKVVIDGGWVAPMPLDRVMRVNRWGPMLPACEAEKRAAGIDPITCVFGPEWLPHWERAGIDVLVAQSGLDSAQLKTLRIRPEERGGFRGEVLASFDGVDHVVSGGFAYHLLAFDPKVGRSEFGTRFLGALDRFWKTGEPEQVLHRYEDAP